MKVKAALAIYFKKQYEFWKSRYSTFPQVPYNKAINECMVIPNSVVDGYVQWTPVQQESVIDFTELESRLYIKIHNSIKEYFSSYWFLSIVGDFSDKSLEFTTIPCGVNVLELLEDNINFGKGKFTDGSVNIEIGSAIIDGDDSFLMYVDNETAMLKCLQPVNMTFISIGLLSDVLENMKVGI